MKSPNKYILFLGKNNSGESIMAEAIFKKINRCPEHDAISAGTEEPDGNVPKNIISILEEINIDISDNKKFFPKTLDSLPHKVQDRIINVYLIGSDVSDLKISLKNVRVEDFGLNVVDGKTENELRFIRDEIKSNVINILKEIYLNYERRCMR